MNGTQGPPAPPAAVAELPPPGSAGDGQVHLAAGRSLWGLEIAAHRGRWGHTGMRATRSELVDVRVQEFGWVLTDVDGENPERTSDPKYCGGGPRASRTQVVIREGMREAVDRDKLLRFLKAFGDAARSAGAVYLAGGATAVSYGWRTQTIDVDLRLDPEPAGAFEAIARLKEELDINVELASPADFLPPVPGWRERSVFVGRFGRIDVYHFDPVSQVLSKLARGYERDLADADAMVSLGLVTPVDVDVGLARIRTGLLRFPRIDVESFAARVAAFVSKSAEGQ